MVPPLGQHFLKNPEYARILAHAASASSGEKVLEIGPGKGILTRELLAAGGNVIAIEKDSSLVKYLEEAFADEIRSGRLTLVEDDVRNFDPRSSKLEARSYCLAANIPYYITGEILRQFLSAQVQPRTIALLVQKEVANRIVARDGKESILSLSVKAYGTPRVVAKVARGNFSPPPSVDSAILLIKNISRAFFSDVDEGLFFRVVKAGFASKRKKLSGNLGKVFGKESSARALAASLLDENERAEGVPLAKWKYLTLQLQGSSF